VVVRDLVVTLARAVQAPAAAVLLAVERQRRVAIVAVAAASLVVADSDIGEHW